MKAGFREIPYQQTGIDEALQGSTVLVLCANKAAADLIQREYYIKLGEGAIDIKATDTHLITFNGGGKIQMLNATRKYNLDGYDKDKTIFRLDWRR